MEQELPLQNIFLYVSGFSGETGRPRFFHIIPLQNGSLYFRWFSFFQVAILLKCLLMSGSPLCRGQWFWKSQKCTKKRGWVPWFCRENPLLDLWQVPHSVEAWGAKSQIWLYKMGTPNPPQVIFWDNLFGTKIAGIFFWILHKRWSCGFIIICSIQRAIFFGNLYGIGNLCRHPSPLGTIFLRRVMKDTFEQLRYFVDERLIFREFGTSWAPSRPATDCRWLKTASSFDQASFVLFKGVGQELWYQKWGIFAHQKTSCFGLF